MSLWAYLLVGKLLNIKDGPWRRDAEGVLFWYLSQKMLVFYQSPGNLWTQKQSNLWFCSFWFKRSLADKDTAVFCIKYLAFRNPELYSFIIFTEHDGHNTADCGLGISILSRELWDSWTPGSGPLCVKIKDTALRIPKANFL